MHHKNVIFSIVILSILALVAGSAGAQASQTPYAIPATPQPVDSTAEVETTSPQNSKADEMGQPLAPGDFTPRAPSPVALTCVTSDPNTGLIYAQQDQGTNFYVYDPRTDIWNPLASAPINSGNNGGAAYLRGKIYTVYTDNNADIGVYDLASSSWSTIPNGLGTGTGVIASDGTYLYLASTGVFKRYFPGTSSWSDLPAPSIGMTPWGGMAFWNGKLYAHAGNGGTQFARYDIGYATWTTLPDLPGGAVLGSAIDPVAHAYYAYGSYAGTNWYAFDLVSETWTSLTLPLFTIDDGGMAYIPQDGISGIYFIQGEAQTGFGRMETIPLVSGDFSLISYSPVPLTSVASDPTTGLIYAQATMGTAFYVYDILPDHWIRLPDSPLNSGNNGGAAYLGGKIYTVYTYNNTDMGVYDIASNTWSTIPNGLGMGTGVIASDGTSLYLAVFDVFKRYYPDIGVWSDLPAPSIDIQPWGGMAFWNGNLYAHRGNGNAQFARYDIASGTWTTLPDLPGGAVLGSAIDPLRQRYYTYGSYSESNWYIFDLNAESWSMETIPFSPLSGVDDGGIVYASRGHKSGIYFTQGESRLQFGRYQDATPSTGGFVINAGAGCVNTTQVTLDSLAEDLETGLSQMRFRNEAPWRALLFQDSLPWGSDAIQQTLDGIAMPFDLLPSSDMATADLTPYSLVIISSVQGPIYYANFNDSLARFESFIDNGGVMLQSFCTYGEPPPINVPFGGTNQFSDQEFNDILDPSHPLFTGVPDPYSGSDASHNILVDLLPDDEVLVTTLGGEAVMIERLHGDGKLLAGGQTFEIGWELSWPNGLILDNALSYLSTQPWAPSLSWELPAGDGVKTVFGQFRNGGGVWSEVYTDTILLDTQPPASSATSPDYDNTGGIPVDWNASDPGACGLANVSLWYRLEDGSWTDSGLAQTGSSGSFIFEPPGGANGIYHFATLASDAAGNSEAAPSGDGDDSTIYDTQPPSSSATSPDYANMEGITVDWNASDAGPSGLADVSLWYRLEDGSWTDSGLVQTGSSGSFIFELPGGANGTYHFATLASDLAGNSEAAPSGEGDDSTIYDTQPPSVVVDCPADTTNLFFDVSWAGTDSLSGVATYDLRFRVGLAGEWIDWPGLVGTTETSSTFGPVSPVAVEREQTYSFQARARDFAGNAGDYSPEEGCSTTTVPAMIYLPVIHRD